MLELAEDPDVPLLERVRFGAIFSRNLDEFFMVRVAALRGRVAAGITTPGTEPAPRRRSGSTGSPGIAHELVARQARLFADELLPALAAAGIAVVRWADLGEDERRAAARRCSPSGSTRS